MGVSGGSNNVGKTLVLMTCFLLVASPFLQGGGRFAVVEATSPEEAAEQKVMVGSTPALETAAPQQQHQHGPGSGASAISSNAAGGLWSAEPKPAVARRLLPGGAVDGAGHSCGSNGRQGCTP